MLNIKNAKNPLDSIMLAMMDELQNWPKQSGRFYYNDLEENIRFKLLALDALKHMDLARAHLLFEKLDWQEWSAWMIGDLSIYPYMMSTRLWDIRYIRSKQFLIWTTLYDAFRIWGIHNNLIQASYYCEKEKLHKHIKAELAKRTTDQPILPKTTVAPAFTPRTAKRVKWVSYLNEVSKPKIFIKGDES